MAVANNVDRTILLPIFTKLSKDKPQVVSNVGFSNMCRGLTSCLIPIQEEQ
jgi:hypothetical protein